MKRNRKYKPAPPSLGELIIAVSAVSRDNREAVAAVADMLERGEIETWKRPKPSRSTGRKDNGL